MLLNYHRNEASEVMGNRFNEGGDCEKDILRHYNVEELLRKLYNLLEYEKYEKDKECPIETSSFKLLNYGR